MKQIQICSGCDGTGEVFVVLPEDHRSNVSTKLECKECVGTGKIITLTFSVDYPFTQNDTIHSRVDANWFEFIRSLRNELKRN